MSAPRTNVEKQKKWHRGPLGGMAVVVAFALILLLIWLGWVAWYGNTPSEPEAQVDDFTGQVEQTDKPVLEEGVPVTTE